MILLEMVLFWGEAEMTDETTNRNWEFDGAEWKSLEGLHIKFIADEDSRILVIGIDLLTDTDSRLANLLGNGFPDLFKIKDGKDDQVQQVIKKLRNLFDTDNNLRKIISNVLDDHSRRENNIAKLQREDFLVNEA